MKLKISSKILLAIGLMLSVSAIYGQKKPVIDGAKRLEMFQNYEDLKQDTSFASMHWQYVGPSNISGRCTDVEGISPRGNNYTIWVGSATGGVWKSINEGVTFESVFDEMPTASIGDIAIDPNNADVVWVGTGEANIFRSSNAGCGVFKTLDGGKSWMNMGLENTHTIGRVVVDYSNSDVVYVAATGHEWTPNKDRGLFKTSDGGKSWIKVLYIDEMTGISDVVMHPTNPNILFATSWERMRLKWGDPRTYENTRNCGVWKSVDGGLNWKQINVGLPEAKFRGRIGIDISKSQPDILYLLLDNYEIGKEAEAGDLDAYGRQKKAEIKGATVYKSTNSGDSWERVSGLDEATKSYMMRHSGTYGWVFGQIRIDPKDPNTIWTMGLFLNKSVDGGKTFTPLREMHMDHHGLWIDPNNPNYLLNVQDGGLSISYDKGANWRSPIEELPLAQFYNISYDFAVPFRIVGSIQDHHSYIGEVDLSRGRDKVRPVEFKPTVGAEGCSHAIDTRDNNTIYGSIFYGSLAKSKIDNFSWGNLDMLLPNPLPEDAKMRGQWVAPTLLSTHNQDIIYHCMQYVMESKDRGQTWKIISPDLTNNDSKKFGDISYQTISAFDESPLHFGLLYAGTDDGRLWRTKDEGQHWEELGGKEIPKRWVSRLVASAYEVGTVYMTQTGRRDDDFQVYIWRSKDFGTTWEDISGNIPLGPVNVIREDPVDENILYVGTDQGVYLSKDKGKTYSILGDLPFAYVHDLKVHPRDNMLIIATHGRGMWILDANSINHKNTKKRYEFPEPEGER
ncbi:MAG: hypothetical protein JXR34_13185 [Bacteroidales bacterium]|nr:hypothetical protein [Bacteroidales bacterium]